MHFLKSFYSATVKYQLTNKFAYRKITKLPKLKKIILNFGSKPTDTKKLFSSLLVFELIANQKGFFTTATNINVKLKVHKGNPSGCKLTVQKHNLFKIFADFLLNILILKKQNKFNLNKNSISCVIKNTFSFLKLDSYYSFFNYLPDLNLTLVTASKNKKELIFFYRLLYVF